MQELPCRPQARTSSATPRATPLRRSRRAPRARLPRSSSAATQQSGVPAAISGLRSLLLLGCLGRQGARHIHTAPSVLWVAVRGGLRERGREGETSSRVSADLVTASCRQPRPRRQIPFTYTAAPAALDGGNSTQAVAQQTPEVVLGRVLKPDTLASKSGGKSAQLGASCHHLPATASWSHGTFLLRQMSANRTAARVA
jgi:hypothetical protein